MPGTEQRRMTGSQVPAVCRGQWRVGLRSANAAVWIRVLRVWCYCSHLVCSGC